MKEKYLEQKVGAFVVAGLVVMAMLVIAFGQFEQVFQSTYTITAEFSDASGIIKNAQVLYRGAKVGKVYSRPQISNQGESVDVVLAIRNDVRIPKNARFLIGVYGLLGDRFVNVVPPPEGVSEETVYLEQGDRVQGSRNRGMDELMANAEEKLQTIDDTIMEFRKRVLTQDFIDDIHGTVKNARSMLERGDALMAEAESGKGPLHILLKDRETASNLKQFIRNLKVSGPLFYSDQSSDDNGSSASNPSEALKRHRQSSKR